MKLDDWRVEMLAQIRTLIKQADPEVVEEVKWVKPTNPGGVPVWSRAGIICTGEAYTNAAKLTLPRAPLRRTLLASLIPAWKAAPGGRLIFMRVIRLMKRRSKP